MSDRRPSPDPRANLRGLAEHAPRQEDAVYLRGLAAAGVPDLALAIGQAAAGRVFSDPGGPPIRAAAREVLALLTQPPALRHASPALPGDLVLAACAEAGLLGDVLDRIGFNVVQDGGCAVVRAGERVLAALPLDEWRAACERGATWSVKERGQ